jgi:hypothetical protein
MSLAANRQRLHAITHDLEVKWAETRESWRDAQSDAFERTYLVELSAEVERAVTVIAQIDQLLQKIRSDCE